MISYKQPVFKQPVLGISILGPESQATYPKPKP